MNPKSSTPKIPRPKNAFILFRQHYHRILIDEWTAQGVEIPHNSNISKIIGTKWKGLQPEDKAHWENLAKKEKLEHERKYPEYKYKPVRKSKKKQLLLHHTLGNGDFTVFHRIASDVACYTTLIIDSELCADEVDKCIKKAWIEQRPVYMGMPVNQVNLPIESARLNTPLDLQLHKNDPDVEKEVISRILSFIYKSQNPAIIVDACTSRQNLIEETKELCNRLKFPVFVTPMGKGTVNETDPQFGGVFTGSISAPEVREVVDFADFIIVIGCMLSEFSTSTFHFQYKTKNCALLYSTSVKLKMPHILT